jgi:hypothetical protein
MKHKLFFVTSLCFILLLSGLTVMAQEKTAPLPPPEKSASPIPVPEKGALPIPAPERDGSKTIPAP